MAKTHFVILLFSPLTATDSGWREKGEGNEADTDAKGRARHEGDGGEKLNWRTFAPLLLLGVSVFQ